MEGHFEDIIKRNNKKKKINTQKYLAPFYQLESSLCVAKTGNTPTMICWMLKKIKFKDKNLNSDKELKNKYKSNFVCISNIEKS